MMGHNPTFYAELAEPQSLNKYHYALNNPLRYIDPDGHQTTTADRLLPAPWWQTVDPATAKAVGREVEDIANTIFEGFKTIGRAVGRSLANSNVADPSCMACRSSERMGQAIMNKAAGDSAQANSSETSGKVDKTIVIDGSRHPESAKHVADAQKKGQPKVVQVGDKSTKSQRRRDALKGTKPVKGKDRDEYPPAWSKQGGKKASIRPISPKDNRGSGGSMGQQIKGLKPGTKVRIKPINVPEN